MLERCACGSQVFCEQDALTSRWIVHCTHCKLRCVKDNRVAVIEQWNKDMEECPREKLYPLAPCVVCGTTNSRIHIYPLEPTQMVAHCSCGAEAVGANAYDAQLKWNRRYRDGRTANKELAHRLRDRRTKRLVRKMKELSKQYPPITLAPELPKRWDGT